MTAGEAIMVRRLASQEEDRWREFVAAAGNGTLFHDLDFLAYHGPDRFDTHHLVFCRGDEWLAVLPAALVRDPRGSLLLQSPYGASVGGWVIEDGLEVAAVLEMVELLRKYAAELGVEGVELRIGPNSYLREPNDLVPFGLMVGGFRLVHRWLTFMVPLGLAGGGSVERLFSPRQRSYVRAGLKKGLHPREVGWERFDDFYALVEETYTRHGASPTHSREDLHRLAALIPGRIRLFLCSHEQAEVAGILIFRLNAQVAYSFYICQSTVHRALRGTAVLFAHLIAVLHGEGYRYLDLGPSVSDTHFNTGVSAFKESLGAQGFCRETWRYDPARLDSSPTSASASRFSVVN